MQNPTITHHPKSRISIWYIVYPAIAMNKNHPYMFPNFRNVDSFPSHSRPFLCTVCLKKSWKIISEGYLPSTCKSDLYRPSNDTKSIFWLFFFTKTKQDQAHPSNVHGKIWPCSTNFGYDWWAHYYISNFFETPCILTDLQFWECLLCFFSPTSKILGMFVFISFLLASSNMW